MKALMIWIAIALVLVAVVLGFKEYKLRYMLGENPTEETNLKAFLQVIRYSEGTAGANGYRTLFGGALFSDLSDHPALTGEWNGAPLPAAICVAAGFSPGCKSFAAGAYQITKTTWKRLKKEYSDLYSFSPENQDKAAVYLIREQGALKDVREGNFNAAIDKVRDVWASLPNSPYGQPTQSLADLTNVFLANGGVVTTA